MQYLAVLWSNSDWTQELFPNLLCFNVSKETWRTTVMLIQLCASLWVTQMKSEHIDQNQHVLQKISEDNPITLTKALRTGELKVGQYLWRVKLCYNKMQLNNKTSSKVRKLYPHLITFWPFINSLSESDVFSEISEISLCGQREMTLNNVSFTIHAA